MTKTYAEKIKEKQAGRHSYCANNCPHSHYKELFHDITGVYWNDESNNNNNNI